jgi:hypothetical protein
VAMPKELAWHVIQDDDDMAQDAVSALDRLLADPSTGSAPTPAAGTDVDMSGAATPTAAHPAVVQQQFQSAQDIPLDGKMSLLLQLHPRLRRVGIALGVEVRGGVQQQVPVENIFRWPLLLAASEHLNIQPEQLFQVRQGTVSTCMRRQFPPVFCSVGARAHLCGLRVRNMGSAGAAAFSLPFFWVDILRGPAPAPPRHAVLWPALTCTSLSCALLSAAGGGGHHPDPAHPTRLCGRHTPVQHAKGAQAIAHARMAGKHGRVRPPHQRWIKAGPYRSSHCRTCHRICVGLWLPLQTWAVPGA